MVLGVSWLAGWVADSLAGASVCLADSLAGASVWLAGLGLHVEQSRWAVGLQAACFWVGQGVRRQRCVYVQGVGVYRPLRLWGCQSGRSWAAVGEKRVGGVPQLALAGCFGGPCERAHAGSWPPENGRARCCAMAHTTLKKYRANEIESVKNLVFCGR